MILRTVPILFEAFGYDGKPAAGALVRAELYAGDGYGPAFDTDASGLVVPPAVSATTGADGRAVLALWPNSRGVRGTQYLFEIARGSGYVDVQALREFGVVPDIIAPDPLPLPLILRAVPPTSVDDAQAAATAAQLSAAEAAADLQEIKDLINGFDPGGGGLRFRYVQTTPAAVWTIPHNLGRWPAVNVFDNAGNLMLSDVRNVDENIVQIIHGAPYSGIAICN